MIISLKKVFATTTAILLGRGSSRLGELSPGSENEPCFPSTSAYPGFLLGVVRGKVVEEAFKWVQSTADSVLGCFLVHLTTPVRSKKDSEYFCPGLLTSPSSPPHSRLRGGLCHW